MVQKIKGFNFLSKIFRPLQITPEIAGEYGEVLPKWIEVHQVKDDLRLRLLEIHLDKGEASAIALAL
jgi:predicted nucleic acid-binding protein